MLKWINAFHNELKSLFISHLHNIYDVSLTSTVVQIPHILRGTHWHWACWFPLSQTGVIKGHRSRQRPMPSRRNSLSWYLFWGRTYTKSVMTQILWACGWIFYIIPLDDYHKMPSPPGCAHWKGTYRTLEQDFVIHKRNIVQTLNGAS